MADGSFEPQGAADALAAMRAARARMLAEPCPPWRHAVFASLMSGTVAAQALPVHVFFGLMGVVFVGMIVFALVMRAKKGFFINGLRAGATRPFAVAGMLAYMAVYTPCWWLRVERGVWVAPLIGAVVLFPLAWWLSRRINAVYRAEMAT